MRILQAVRDMHPREGGPPRVVTGSSVALADAGHDVTIVASVVPGEEDAVFAAWPELSAAGVTLRLYPKSGPSPLGGSKALADALARDAGGYDIFHLHGVWDQVLVAAGKAARRARRPYLLSPHGMLDPWSMARSGIKKQVALRLLGVGNLLNRAAAVVYGTQDEADVAAPLGFRSPVAVIPNGVPATMLGARDPDARRRLHDALPQSRDWQRIVLFYARLHPKKGLDMLVEAFAAVAAEFPGSALLAAGIPEDIAHVEAVTAQVAATGLNDRICITSQFSGPSSRFLLDAVDLFALPSHQEGFSIAIVEAMARGLPMLITDRCHLPEVQAEGAGRVVPATPAALAEGLRAMLSLDDTALAAAGDAGNRLVAARYTWPQVARVLESAYSAATR